MKFIRKIRRTVYLFYNEDQNIGFNTGKCLLLDQNVNPREHEAIRKGCKNGFDELSASSLHDLYFSGKGRHRGNSEFKSGRYKTSAKTEYVVNSRLSKHSWGGDQILSWILSL